MKSTSRLAGRSLHVVLVLVSPLVSLHCGDGDEGDTTSSGGGTSSSVSTSTSTSSQTSSSTSSSSQSSSSGNEGGGGSGGNGGSGGHGGGGGDAGGGGGGSVVDVHLASMVDAICGNIGPCCEEEALPFDEAECASFLTAFLSRLVPSDPSLATFDETAAAACIDAATDLGAACPQTLAQQRSFTEACGSVFAGTLDDGEACEAHPECSAPSGGLAYCIPGPSGAVCNQLTLGALGEACVGDTFVDESGERLVFSFSFETSIVVCDLNAGLVCDPDAVEPTCRASFEIGDSCPGTGSCAPGLACLFDGEGGLVCAPRAAAGEPCDREQPGEVCEEGLYCTEDTAVCAPRLAVGEACSEATDCLSLLCDEDSGLCQGAYSNRYVCDGELGRRVPD